MKTSVAENVFTISNFFSADECRTMIERGEAIGFQRASVRTKTGPQMLPNVRDNDRAEFNDIELANDLWVRAKVHLPAMLEGGEAIGLDEHFRFYRYDIGQRFKQHIDGVVEKSPSVRSRLSFLIYLNGDFEGGETVFFGAKQEDGLRREIARISPRQGDALVFLHEWRHEGRALVSGRKYVLRTDVFFRFALATEDGTN